MEQIVGVAQLYFMPHPLLEIVQRLMAHPVVLGMYNFGLMLTSCLLGSRATAVELDSNHARNFFISKKRIVTIYFL